MQGEDARSGVLFSYVGLEARVPKMHLLRVIREPANAALSALAGEFSALYASMGRPSIPPEKLLRAMLLQAFYSIRSERQLMERLEFDLLFRWFAGLGVEDPVWDHSVFSKNRDRLLDGDVAAKFLSAVLAQPRVKQLLSNDHSSGDGTLIEAWASMKSFVPKGAGKEAKLCFTGHALMENRNALFVNELRSMRVTLHVAQNVSGRPPAIDGRTARHEGYRLSQRIRKRIEEGFGRIKTVAGQEKTKFRGCDRVGFAFTFAAPPII